MNPPTTTTPAQKSGRPKPANSSTSSSGKGGKGGVKAERRAWTSKEVGGTV